MQEGADSIVAMIGIVIALSVAVGKFVGPLQTDISQALIDAWRVPSHYRRLLNLIVGVVLGTALFVVLAIAADTWVMVPAGVLAGVMAAVEASRVHDQDGAFQAGVDTGIREARQALRHVPPGEGERRRVA